MGEGLKLIFECGAAIAIIEGIKAGIGWIVKRAAAKKDKKEEKTEKKVEEQIDEARQDIEQIKEQMKVFEEMLDLQRETSKFILYDRLRYLAKCFLADGEISFEDRNTWNAMHECYHKNGGNGTMKQLAEAVNALPVKKG